MDSLYQPEPDRHSLITVPCLIAAEATLAEAIALMTSAEAPSPDSPRCLLVTAGDRLIGLFAEANLLSCLKAGVSLSTTTVQQWMTPNPTVLSVSQAEQITQIGQLLQQSHYLPVVDAAYRPLGLVTATSLLQALDAATLAASWQQPSPALEGEQADTVTSALAQPSAIAATPPPICSTLPPAGDAARLRQYAHIVFEAPDRICLIDRHGCYQIANRAYLEWKNQTESIIGTSARETVGYEIYDRLIKPRLERCLAGESIYYEEWVTIGLHPEFVRITYTPYVEPDGEISAALITIRDISQLKRAERAEDQLRQREAFLRNIFDSAAEVIWVAERLEDDEYWIVSANQSVQSILGISTLDWIGRRLEELWTPETAATMRSRYQTCLQQGQPITWEGPIATATGSKWMLTTLSRLDDCQGKPRVLGISLDISDRKQAEASLQMAEAMHRTILAALPDLMIRMQADGTYLDIKPASESPMIPIAPGDNIWEVLPIDLARQRMELVDIALATQEIQVYEYELAIQQLVRWQEARIVPLRADEVLVIIRDVTDRYLAEAARQQALRDLQQLNQDLENRVAQRTAELRESEQRFRAIFEQAAVGIAQSDMSGRFIRANQRFCQLTGYSEQELLHKTYQELTPPEQHALDTHYVQQMVTGEIDSVTIEKQYIRKNGALQWVSLTVSLLHDATGQPMCDMAVIQDISARKAAEAALRESEERFRAIFEQAAVGISQTDLAGRYLQVNQTFCQLLGYSESELLGQFWQAVTHPDDLTKDGPMMRQVFDGQIKSFSTEKRYLRKDGEVLWTQKTLSVVRDENNAVAYVIAVIEDISDRKRAEQALQASQQQLASIADNIPGNIFREVFHPDGSITFSFMSQGEQELSGLSPEAIKYDRRQLLATVHPADRDNFERQLLASAKALEPFDYEYRVIHTSGETRWARESICFFQLENGDIVGDGITLDITRRKQAEAKVHQALSREKELNQLKSRFISMTSHEFRTPLAVIASSAGILQEFADKLSEERKQQHLETIQTYIKHTTRLLDDILLINRAEAGKLSFRPHTLLLIEFCRALLAELQISIAEHEIVFVVYHHQAIAPARFEIEVSADRELLRHILCNLISNAAKYSEANTPIEVKLTVESDRIAIQIRDQGMGIPPEDQPQLFEAFHRARNVGNIAGTGLGLSIVKQCLDLHNGQISFESYLGQGTTFTVVLPLAGTILAID
ncbi:PAS domain S-box protein [Almyronema epifaneia]|uniref:histidine kinase n=1 Tax=Almyronema epifaneia S1 TaxID=2991925 RepID=A0ABW6IBN3_9CYAN